MSLLKVGTKFKRKLEQVLVRLFGASSEAPLARSRFVCRAGWVKLRKVGGNGPCLGFTDSLPFLNQQTATVNISEGKQEEIVHQSLRHHTLSRIITIFKAKFVISTTEITDFTDFYSRFTCTPDGEGYQSSTLWRFQRYAPAFIIQEIKLILFGIIQKIYNIMCKYLCHLKRRVLGA